MADYTYPNGNITMMIRDLGIGNNYVEYWVLTDQYTYNHQQQWSGTGHNVETFDMNNRGSWQYIGNCYIGSSQNVSFTMYNANIGFPTYTFTVWINRQSVPPAPKWADVHPSSSSSVYARFDSAGDGGAAVDIWQIGYGIDPNAPQYFTNNYVANIGGLDNRYTWYFWGRGHNAVGWGPWNNRVSAIPFRIPDVPTPVSLSVVTQNSVVAEFKAGPWDGGTPLKEWQIGYGLDPNTPQLFRSLPKVQLSDLSPGRTYYFWSRTRNDVGWSGWSPVRLTTLIAGARVLDAGVAKRAVPYVNVGGVWKLARPWAKSGGVWKETLQ